MDTARYWAGRAGGQAGRRRCGRRPTGPASPDRPGAASRSPAVEDQVDVDDGRGPSSAKRSWCGHRIRGEQDAGDVVGDGDDHRVGVERPIVGRDGEAGPAGSIDPPGSIVWSGRSSARFDRSARFDGPGGHPEADVHARPVEGGGGPLAVELAEGHPAPADVGRARASLSSPVWKTLAAMASDASAAGRLTVGTVIRSHRAATAGGRLAVAGQPGPEGLAGRGPGRRGRGGAGPARPARAARRSATADAGSGAATRPGAGAPAGALRRSRPIRGGPPGRVAGATTGRSRRSGARRLPGADPVEEREVRVQQRRNTCWPLSIQWPACRNDQVSPPRRLRRSSRVTRAPRRRSQGGGQPGQAAADHHDPAAGAGGPAHAAPLSQGPHGDRGLLPAGSDIRPRSTPAGSRWMRSSRRR